MANLNDFQEQLDILNATKTSIKEAIISKGQDVSSEDSFSSYADKIDDIVTLDEGTADANANADDILLDKTAYVNGVKVTGTLETATAVSIDNSNNTDTHLTLTNVDNIPSVVVGADINDLYGVKKVVEDGVGLEIIAPQSQFADVIGLTTDKIKAEETILGISGKSTIVDTEDANAVGEDLLMEKTAYVNGEKIEGLIEDRRNEVIVSDYTSIDDTDTNNISINGQLSYASNICVSADANVETVVPKSTLATSIGLTSNKMPVGVSILGINGTYTDDANATASDIVAYKTAYVNGQKVVGNMHYAGGTISGQTYHRFEGTSFDLKLDGFPKSLVFNTDNLSQNGYIPAGRYVKVWADIDALNSYIGLTADKIKQGETILGITGNVIELNGETKTITPTTSQQAITPSQDKNAITEVTVNAVTSAIDSNIQAENIKNGVTILGITGTAQVIKEYSTYQEIEQALLDGDIETGDIVLCGGTYTFYLCEMNTETGDSYLEKLVKESETISPSDYTEAEEQIGDLFGEEENN